VLKFSVLTPVLMEETGEPTILMQESDKNSTKGEMVSVMIPRNHVDRCYKQIKKKL
jgi:hypothetical protein